VSGYRILPGAGRRRTAVRLCDFAILTFDCYGTLIDWERGICDALAPWLARHASGVGEEHLLALFAAWESAEQRATPGAPYPRILERVMHRIGESLGLEVREEEAEAFGASVGSWPPFPDTVQALAYLREHFPLAVLSNVDRASFARSQALLGVAFDFLFTAEDIGSYKPDPRNFRWMIDRLAEAGIPRQGILHVAQSLFHDILPARKAGLATCWIDRRAGRPGGATPAVEEQVRPDFRFESLAGLVEAHRREMAA